MGLPLVYAGDHGLEIHGAGLQYVVPEAQNLRRAILAISNDLRAGIEPFRGALVECKRLSASVHVRQVERGQVPAIAAVVQAELRRYPLLRLCPGRAVFEIRPRTGWHKGSAARWILDQFGGNERDTICIGDDATDEDMFSELDDGITVHVGSDGATAAQYRLAQTEVLDFLRFLREEVNQSRHSSSAA